MNHRTLVALAAATVALLTSPLLGTARAGSTSRGEFDMDFGARKPGRATSIHLRIRFKGRTPSAKPSPIRKVVIAAPQGTRFDTTALPRCTASNETLMAEGDSACPSGSRLGGGHLTAITGFGAPFDPFVTDVSIYNAPDEIVELVKDPSTGRPLAADRFQIRGSTWIGHPPATPGGPPDGQTAVRDIDFVYAPKARWATTPGKCGAAARWRSSGTFTYADGVTTKVPDSVPCAPPRRPDGGPGPSPGDDGWRPTAAPRSAAPRG